MSKSKHTPGPWDAILPYGLVKKGEKSYPESVKVGKKEDETFDEMLERIEPERKRFWEEASANQRLQRMAPEMLGMLEHCRKVLGGEVAGWHTDVLQVDALIAKVKGEE